MNDMHESGEGAVAPASWPKVVGILSLVFGILALTCSVLGTAMAGFSGSLMTGLMSGQLPPGTPPPPFTPPIDALMIASIAIGVSVNVVLIVAGAKLIKRSQGGRSMHLVYALLAIVAAFFGTFVTYQGQQAQQQAMQAWVTEHGDKSDETRAIKQSWNQQAQMQGPMQAISIVVGLVVALAWPVFCIIWFGMVKKTVPPVFDE
jgi:hypothetical protein